MVPGGGLEGDLDQPAGQPDDEAGDLVHFLDEEPHLGIGTVRQLPRPISSSCRHCANM